MIASRYRSVMARTAEAARRAGRRPEDVTVLVAAKTFGAAAIREAIDAGARDVGENYVQEAAAKARELADVRDLRWHLIGRLQRNKTRAATNLFHLIHSLDRIDLARGLDRAAADVGRTVRCLVEVNLGDEATKAGLQPSGLEAFLGEIAALEHVSIAGLMTIPPPAPASASGRAFAALRELGERLGRLRLPNVQLKELSMGMSGDFEEAIAEGATIVRLGTAIFGPRDRRERSA